MNYGEENLPELTKVFQLVDKDHGGTISKDELMELMDTLGINPTTVSHTYSFLNLSLYRCHDVNLTVFVCFE